MRVIGDMHAMARLRPRDRPLYVTKIQDPWQGMHGPERRLAIRCRQAAVRGRCPYGGSSRLPWGFKSVSPGQTS
jgi:hypothetical protein